MPGQAAIRINENEWAVSLATTYAELVQGLSGVPSMPAGTGMLFILPADQPVSVTTQPLLFNIDIVFISSDLEVVDVAKNIAPGNIVTESTPVRYFLEVNAGEAYGIESGDVVGITVYQPAGTVANWISPLVSIAGLMAVGAFMVNTVRNITRAILGEPKKPELLPKTKRGKLTGDFIINRDRMGNIIITYTLDIGKSVFLQFEADKEVVYDILTKEEKEDVDAGWRIEVRDDEPRASILEELWEGAEPTSPEFLPQATGGRALVKKPRIEALAPKVIPTGTCYEDAWRFLLREEEGELIHGSVESQGKRIKHAWVELPTGFIWEPENKLFVRIAEFKTICKPKEDSRYSITEAAIMAGRTKNFGPWSEEEKKQCLKEKSLAAKPSEYLPQVSTATRLDRLEIVKAYKQISRHGEDKISVSLEAWAIFPRGRKPHFISMYRSGDEYIIQPLYTHVAEWVEVPVAKVKAWIRSLPVRHFEPMAVAPQLRAEAERLAREVDEPLDIVSLPSKEPAARVIPVERRPRREGDLEYLADSPEFLTQTIEDIGYRDKLDTTFQEAIARAKGLK